MKHILTYIKTPQRLFAFLFLILFPIHTVWIYAERFVNGYKWEYGTLAYYGIEALGWLFVLTMLIPMARRVSFHKFQVTTDRRFVLALLIFLLYSGLSALWAVDSNLAQQQTTNLMLMCLVALLLPAVLSKKEIVGAFSAGALLPMGAGLYQFFSQSLPGSSLLGMSGQAVENGGVSVVQFGDERWLRAYGTFAHPNVFGGYLAVLIGSMLLVLKSGVGKYVRLWYMVLLLLSGVSLVLTMSRSAWLATAVGVVAIMYTVSKHAPKPVQIATGKGIVTLGIGIVFAVSIAWPLVATRLGGGTAYEYQSVHERVALQYQAQDIFTQHPIVGVGAGNMTAALIEADDTKFGYIYQPVHNVFMLLLVEYGMVGVHLLILVCYYFVRFIIALRGTSLHLAPLVLFLPLLLFDHYLSTAVHGLGIGAVFLAILLSPTGSSSAELSQNKIDG